MRMTCICGAVLSMEVAEIDGISAGGMPERVKCLHCSSGGRRWRWARGESVR